MIGTYRRLPIEIQAVQYTKRESTRAEVIEFGGDKVQHTSIDDNGSEYDLLNLRIETIEGVLMLQPGDWLIHGVEGEFYPCKDSIFRATYEVVP